MMILALVLVGSILSGTVRGEEGSVNSHGLDIHYQIYGQGKPVLVLGGGPGDVAGRYTGLCELLAPEARCILVEQRGTGRSTPAVQDGTTITVALTLDDFEAIRTQLGLKQWAVVGFSYGGYLASLYAHFYPESVSSLVLLDSMGLNWDGLPQFEDNVECRLWSSDRDVANYWSQKEKMKDNSRQAITEIIRARMPGYFYDRKKALPVSQSVKPDDFNFAMGDWIYRDTQARKLDLAAMPPAFSGPVLVVHGRQDPSGESVPLFLSRYYRNARLVFIEKCGHYSWAEQPEGIRAAIAGFLNPAGPGEKPAPEAGRP